MAGPDWERLDHDAHRCSRSRDGHAAERERSGPWRHALREARPICLRTSSALREVPAIYKRLAQETDTISNAIRFIMLTACRLREVLDAKFDEIDFAAQTFSVPPAREQDRRAASGPAVVSGDGDHQGAGRAASIRLRVPGRFGGALGSSTVAPALKRIGLTNTTMHGFRSSFRSWAAE